MRHRHPVSIYIPLARAPWGWVVWNATLQRAEVRCQSYEEAEALAILLNDMALAIRQERRAA